jgi:hypothetical protein
MVESFMNGLNLSPVRFPIFRVGSAASPEKSFNDGRETSKTSFTELLNAGVRSDKDAEYPLSHAIPFDVVGVQGLKGPILLFEREFEERAFLTNVEEGGELSTGGDGAEKKYIISKIIRMVSEFLDGNSSSQAAKVEPAPGSRTVGNHADPVFINQNNTEIRSEISNTNVSSSKIVNQRLRSLIIPVVYMDKKNGDGGNSEPADDYLDQKVQKSKNPELSSIIKRFNGSAMHVSLYALENGLRFVARMPGFSETEQEALRLGIQKTMNEFGVLNAEIIVEILSVKQRPGDV